MGARLSDDMGAVCAGITSTLFSAPPLHVAPMLSKVLLRQVRLSGVDPFDLWQAAQRIAQMREVDPAGTVVVR